MYKLWSAPLIISKSVLPTVNVPEIINFDTFGSSFVLGSAGSDDDATRILLEFGSSIIVSCGNGVCFAPTILTPVSGCSWYGP